MVVAATFAYAFRTDTVTVRGWLPYRRCSSPAPLSSDKRSVGWLGVAPGIELKDFSPLQKLLGLLLLNLFGLGLVVELKIVPAVQATL